MEAETIYELLGLPADADVERLRAAYEAAMATATARGDWPRAATLSSAFDALPRPIRLAVYSGRERDASPYPPTAQRRRPGAREARRRRRSLTNVLILGVAGVGALVLCVPWLSHHAHRPTTNAIHATSHRPPKTSLAAGAEPSGRATYAPAPGVPTWSPMRALHPDSGEVLIPADAIVDADGFARVLCPNSTGTTWSMAKVRPGQFFVCPSGVVGQVRMRSATR